MAALRAAWLRHRRFFVVAYGVAVGVLVVSVAIAHLTKRGTLYLFGDLIRIREQPGAGFFTLVSGFCLASSAVLVALRPTLAASARRSERWAWWGVASGLLLLACDEILMIHEQVSDALEAVGVPKLAGVVEQDVYIFGLYAVVAAVLAGSLRHALVEHPEVVLALLAMVVFFGCSQLLDMVPFHDLNRMQQRSLGPAEEGFKVLGSWSVLLAGILLVRGSVEAHRPADSPLSPRP